MAYLILIEFQWELGILLILIYIFRCLTTFPSNSIGLFEKPSLCH